MGLASARQSALGHMIMRAKIGSFAANAGCGRNAISTWVFGSQAATAREISSRTSDGATNPQHGP